MARSLQLLEVRSTPCASQGACAAWSRSPGRNPGSTKCVPPTGTAVMRPGSRATSNAVLEHMLRRLEHRLAIRRFRDKRRYRRRHPRPAGRGSRRPSSRAGAARVRIAISCNVNSRVIDRSAQFAAPPRDAAWQLLSAEAAVHQQADQMRVAGERAAVRMIGRQHHLPRVFERAGRSPGRSPTAAR